MSHRVREIAGPGVGIAVIIAVLLAIDERLLNRSTRLIEDLFTTHGQADRLMLTFLAAGTFLLVLMLRT